MATAAVAVGSRQQFSRGCLYIGETFGDVSLASRLLLLLLPFHRSMIY